MKRLLSFLIVGLAGLAATVSCNVGLESIPQPSKHTVYFTTSENSPVTKTGITIDNTTVTPDWRLTKAENVHLFEYQAANTVSVGEDVEIAIGADNLTATFKADFPEDMTIIVDPTEPEPDGAKGGSRGAKGSGSYTYAAVIAQQGDAKDLKFVVPAVQYPDPNTLIDPDADFLIGYNSTVFTDPHDYEENVVDLYFDRPVALGRLSLTNFFGTDESVKSVTIAAQGGMSGSAGLGDIDFAKASVNFKADTEGGITLSYGKNGQAVSDGAFVAYFVSLPGSVTLTSIEVVTDQYVYTKAFDGGKTLALSNESFKSLKLDLSTAAREAATPESNTWYKASVLEDGIDYLIVSDGQALKNNDGATAGVSVTDNGGVITFEGATDPTLVWTATAYSGLEDYGHFTLSNGEGNYLQRKSNQQDQNIIIDGVPSGDKKYYVWNYDGTYLSHVSSPTDNRTFYCYYNGGWSTSYQEADAKPVAIYTSRAPQELAFSPAASAEYDLATGSWTVVVPALTGAYTPVTYALSDDSNPAVATVDADGTVHPLSVGTVKVVATAAGNAQYQAATASYTLRVINSNIQSTRYVLASSIEAGKNYLVVSGGQALKNNGGNVASVAVTPADGAIEIESGMETDLVWTSKAESGFTANGHFSLSNGGYRMNRVSNSGNFSLNFVDATEAMDKYGVWDLQTYNGNTYLFHDSSNTMRLWVYYDGGWKVTYAQNSTNPSSTEKPTQLYVEDDGRLPQTPSFSPAEVNYDMAGSAALVKPTLSNAIGTVTYSSGDETIATVDPSSGDVTVKKKGTVEIIASAAGNGQYKPGSASYNLVITDSSNPVTEDTYVKVTSASNLVVGAKYLLVYESTPSVFKPILNGSTFKKTADNVQSVTISNHSITSAELADCELTLTEGYYLYVESAERYVYPLFDGNQTTSLEAESSPSHNLSITINSDGTAKITNAASTASSFTWSTRSSYFSSTTSETATINVCLYKEDDGSNPGGGDDPTPTVTTTYYLASSIEAGKSYVIVSDGKALKNDNGSATAVGVTVNSGSIQVEGDVTSLLWAASTDPDKASAFRFTNNDQTLRRSSGNVSIGNPSSSAYNNQWTYSSSSKHVMLERSSTQTYYLYYNEGWKANETVGEALLYTTEPGSNPGGGDDPEPPTQFTYTQITSVSELTDGASYLIVSSDANSYNSKDHQTLFAGDEAGTAVAVSASSGTITGDYSNYEFVITKKSGSDYSLHGPNGYVTGNSGTTRYIQVSNSEGTMSLTNATELNAADSGDGLVSNAFYFYYTKSNSKEVLYLNADGKYKVGGTGRKYGVYLYKKADNP